LSSEATENYHDFKKYIYIDDSTRTISASILDNCVNIGLSKKLEITDNATSQSPTYTYSSSNTSIATVDADGNVTGIAPGVVSITISSPATKNYKAGSAVITFYCEEYIAPLDKMIYDYDFNFSDEDWATRFPECYSVSNSYAWYTDYTFTYNNRRTLRSYKGLSNNRVSKT
jgi:hypothetical protein